MVRWMGVGGSVCGFWVSGSLNVSDGGVKRKGCGRVGYGDWIPLACLVDAEKAIHCDNVLADDGLPVVFLTGATYYVEKGAVAWEICCRIDRPSCCVFGRMGFVIDYVRDREISSRPCGASYGRFSNGHCFYFFHGRSYRDHPEHFEARELRTLNPKEDFVGLSRRDCNEAWQFVKMLG